MKAGGEWYNSETCFYMATVLSVNIRMVAGASNPLIAIVIILSPIGAFHLSGIMIVP